MKFTKGQQVKELLVELKDIITSLTFPKNMRWANNDKRYARLKVLRTVIEAIENRL